MQVESVSCDASSVLHTSTCATKKLNQNELGLWRISVPFNSLFCKFGRPANLYHHAFFLHPQAASICQCWNTCIIKLFNSFGSGSVSLPDSNAWRNSCTLTWPRKSYPSTKSHFERTPKVHDCSHALHHQLALRCNVVGVFKKGSSTAPLLSSSITLILQILLQCGTARKLGRKVWTLATICSNIAIQEASKIVITSSSERLGSTLTGSRTVLDCVRLSDPVKRCSSDSTSSFWNHIVMISTRMESDLDFLKHFWKLHLSTSESNKGRIQIPCLCKREWKDMER